jgi:hypothetical protein
MSRDPCSAQVDAGSCGAGELQWRLQRLLLMRRAAHSVATAASVGGYRHGTLRPTRHGQFLNGRLSISGEISNLYFFSPMKIIIDACQGQFQTVASPACCNAQLADFCKMHEGQLLK